MPSETKWTYRRDGITGNMLVVHADDGRVIATVQEEPYAPQLAAVPDLYEALDRITDITIAIVDSAPKAMRKRLSFIADLGIATASALKALAKARGESVPTQSPKTHQYRPWNYRSRREPNAR